MTKQSHARRRTKRKQDRHITGLRGSWGMLLVGLASGVALHALYSGMQDSDGDGLGSGLKVLLEQQQSADLDTTPAEPVVPGPAAEKKPELDFYTVLPEIERVMPDSDFNSEGPTKERKVYSYILQAASYRDYRDADRLKARLALEGHESSVQKVTVQGKGVYYRVRMGPYTSKRALKNVRQKLARLGVRAIALRLSDD